MICLTPSTGISAPVRLRKALAEFLVILMPVMIVCALAPQAGAGDLVVGLGADNIGDDDFPEAATALAEYHTDPFGTFFSAALAGMGVLEADADGDVYTGAGLSALWSVSRNCFIEGSMAAGYYDKGSDSLDLGGTLQFQSLVGFGYRLSDKTRISIALSHLSNAGIEDINPGRNALYLRYTRGF